MPNERSDVSSPMRMMIIFQLPLDAMDRVMNCTDKPLAAAGEVWQSMHPTLKHRF
jgi:hypothetical protein